MSNKQELTARSKELKDAIDEQINTFKDRVEKYGKVGLWIGGGLVAVYLLSKIFIWASLTTLATIDAADISGINLSPLIIDSDLIFIFWGTIFPSNSNKSGNSFNESIARLIEKNVACKMLNFSISKIEENPTPIIECFFNFSKISFLFFDVKILESFK